MGIFGGLAADNLNRKWILCISCLLWSATSWFTGAIHSFAVLFLMRFLMGLFQAFYNPTAFSAISDLFAKGSRTTANSVFNLGIYFGGAMASLSGVLIVNVGWRLTYEISAYLGFAFGIIGIFLIPDMKRNRFDPKPEMK